MALFYSEDCSHKDIAAVLEVAAGTVKSRLACDIAQLRDILLSEELHAPTLLNVVTHSGTLVPVSRGNFSALLGSHLDHSRV